MESVVKKTITVEVWKDGDGRIYEVAAESTESRAMVSDGACELLGRRTLELDAPAEDEKPKEFWVGDTHPLGHRVAYETPDPHDDTLIHVVELPRGHRVLSDADLWKAWMGGPTDRNDGQYSTVSFIVFLRALGFGGSDE